MQTPSLGPEKQVAFQLANHSFSLGFSEMREFAGGVEVTPVASNQPAYLGTIRRKGQMIPVIDLRRQFGLPQVSMTLQNSFVVVALEGQKTAAALWVDALLPLLDAAPEALEPVSEMLSPVPVGYLRGQIRLNGQIFYRLNLERVLQDAPLGLGEEAVSAWFETDVKAG
jgi:purine-binding chemotaxis protein CheW